MFMSPHPSMVHGVAHVIHQTGMRPDTFVFGQGPRVVGEANTCIPTGQHECPEVDSLNALSLHKYCRRGACNQVAMMCQISDLTSTFNDRRCPPLCHFAVTIPPPVPRGVKDIGLVGGAIGAMMRLEVNVVRVDSKDPRF